MSDSHGRLRLGWHAAAIVTAVAAVVAALVGPAVAPQQAVAQVPGLETLGELPHPPCDEPNSLNEPGKLNQRVVGINTDVRRLYTVYGCGGWVIAAWDISTEIPTLAQVSPPLESGIRVWTSNTLRVAPDLGQIFVLGLSKDNGDWIVIEVLDLETLESLDTWELSREKTRGFVPLGFTYDADRDRIYLMGTLEGSLLLNSGLGAGSSNGTVPNAAVVAIDARTGDQLWINPLRGCDTPMNSTYHGTLIAMSAKESRLYGFCAGGSAANTKHGQQGIIRLDVSGQDDASGVQDPATGATFTDFPSEFFPVSGDYASGVVALDPVRERFVAHSLSEDTHGAWVFDGRRSSWVGFVAAPDDTNAFYGLDLATGKHYMGGGARGSSTRAGTGYINVTDVGATPVPQGRRFDDIRSTSTPWARDVDGSLTIQSNMMVDPSTGRLFVAYEAQDPNISYVSMVRGVLVLRDTTPPITPRSPLDLDELTHDLPDDDEARLEFSANGSGFGAQYVQVGGWENFSSRPGLPLLGAIDVGNPANIRYGNRGATMSLVEQIGVASSGSSATAIATQPDDNTPADAENKARPVTEPLPDDGDEEADEAGRVTCLDGNGEPLTNEDGVEEAPAYAVVRCDLENLTTTAHAHFSGGSGGGGVVVSDSSFDGRTYRDPERGVVTETEAIAEGIFFGEADLGGFGIDRVISTATTWANGLDGTSHVKWVRTVEGMRTIAADGTASEKTSCTTTVESGKKVVEEGDCKSLQETLNELIPNRFEVKFPRPEVVATPGGAFASVQENEGDFLNGQTTYNDQRRVVPGMEMTVFADGPQRGRLWAQLAAVKADATFIRSPLPPPFDDSTGGAGTATIDEGGTTAPPATAEGEIGAFEVPDNGGTTAGPPVPIDEPSVAADEDPPLTIASHQERLVGGFGWLPALRSLGDAVLTGALYLVFLLPIAEIVRRRRLLDVLTDAGSTDESSPSVSRSPARAAGSPASVSASPVGSTS